MELDARLEGISTELRSIRKEYEATTSSIERLQQAIDQIATAVKNPTDIISDVIDTIALEEGWEETGDKYRRMYGIY